MGDPMPQAYPESMEHNWDENGREERKCLHQVQEADQPDGPGSPMGSCTETGAQRHTPHALVSSKSADGPMVRLDRDTG